MAWLLRIDMHTQDDKPTCTLEDIANYPRFCDHMNPPYPSDLPKYLNNKSEGDRQLRQPRRLKRKSLSKPPDGEVRYSLQDSKVWKLLSKLLDGEVIRYSLQDSNVWKLLSRLQDGEVRYSLQDSKVWKLLNRLPEGEVTLQDSKVLMKFLSERPTVVILFIVLLLRLPTVT
ncbi:unnamed protein product [Urochloa humidicola]